MRFFSHEKLLQLLSETDLYVHACRCGDRGHGICIEAFSKVVLSPVMTDPKSVTPAVRPWMREVCLRRGQR